MPSSVVDLYKRYAEAWTAIPDQERRAILESVGSEITAHDDHKKRIVEVDEDCSTVALSTLGDTWRVLANDTVREVRRLEAAGVRRHAECGELT